jgi:hypothetical protein
MPWASLGSHFTLVEWGEVQDKWVVITGFDFIGWDFKGGHVTFFRHI